VGLLVEQEHRRRLRVEDRTGGRDSGLEQRTEGVVRAEDARGDGCAQVGHAPPPTFVAVRCSTLFSWNGVSSGCLLSTSAQRPATWGVAKLLPVALIVSPPSQATSTFRPRAKNSTGGWGFA